MVGPAAGVELLGQFLERRLGVEIRAVRADIDGNREDQAGGRVQAEAGEPAVGVAYELASGGVGHVVVDAAMRERGRVHQRVVPRHVVRDHGMVTGCPVQVPAGRETGVGVLGVVHAEPADPAAGWVPGRLAIASTRSATDATPG